MFIRATALVVMPQAILGVSCTTPSYVFGFGYVNGQFLFDSFTLRRLTLIFSATHGRVGPQGRGSCPVKMQRPPHFAV
jgi:hypothetical protein